MGNLFPRVVDKSLMIFEHCKKGSIEDAERLCDQMIDEGGISIEGALKLVEEITARGCVPNTETYSSLIDVLCRNENL
ncbi:hypothetical protein JHK85_004699 [Glycine max]|nr:hypothetical protein JHK85_004699 [Glycine max]